MTKKNKSARVNRTVYAVIGIIILAIASGLLGGSLGHRGGGASTAADYSSTPFLDSIKSRGELRVGVAENPPFEGKQKDGTLDGPDLLPLKQLAKALKVKYVTVPADWSNIVAGLQANRYDFAADLNPTAERAQSIQFTQVLYSYENVFVVKANSPYVTADEVIKGGPISSVIGTAANDALVAAGGKLMTIDTNANQVSTLNAGRVIATYVALPTAIDLALRDSNYKIIIPKPAIYSAGSAYGVAASADPRSLQIINITIQNSIDSGELGRAFDKAGVHLDVAGYGNLIKK